MPNKPFFPISPNEIKIHTNARREKDVPYIISGDFVNQTQIHEINFTVNQQGDFMRKVILMPTLLTALMALAACSSAPQKTDEASSTTNTPAATASAAPATSQPVGSSNYDPLQDPNHALAKRSIYFAFDDFQIKDEFSSTIAAHADYLSKNRGQQIVIEGHADERGSSEYNLALGQKRAEAVRRSLELLGASGKQMEAVSLGEEKPRAQGSNESAWAENRRADIIYK